MVFFDEDFRRGLQQTCWLCSRPENGHLRREWGCREPLEQPWFELECWLCRDQPPEARPLCRVCQGSQRVPLHRCPWSMISVTERVVCQVASYLEAGIVAFSERPGWADLPASLVEAVGLVAREKAEIEKRRWADG